MTKVIEIVSCLQCAHLNMRKKKCFKHQKYIDSTNDIPDWCTFDTKEEYLRKNRDEN